MDCPDCAMSNKSHYLNTGMKDINGVDILEGSLIRADGYGTDLKRNSFYCVVYEDGCFYSCIYGDSDPINTYRTIEVVGHAEDYRDVYETGDWSGNLGEGIVDPPLDRHLEQNKPFAAVYGGQWVSVEDRLPEMGERVLVDYDGETYIARLSEFHWIGDKYNPPFEDVKAWMLLPSYES